MAKTVGTQFDINTPYVTTRVYQLVCLNNAHRSQLGKMLRFARDGVVVGDGHAVDLVLALAKAKFGYEPMRLTVKLWVNSSTVIHPSFTEGITNRDLIRRASDFYDAMLVAHKMRLASGIETSEVSDKRGLIPFAYGRIILPGVPDVGYALAQVKEHLVTEEMRAKSEEMAAFLETKPILTFVNGRLT